MRSSCHGRINWGLAGLLMGGAVMLHANTFRAVDLQAVFLLRFSSFVEWPEEALPAPETPFVIGVLGRDPFGPMLDRIMWGETVNGSPVRVVRYPDAASIDYSECPILFISRSERRRLPAIMQTLQGRPTLTVSDIPDFAKFGGMITFIDQQNRVQLVVNLDAVRAAHLTISSKLLRSVELVGSAKADP